MNNEFFAHFKKKWDGHPDKDMETQVILLCEGILENRVSAQKKLKNWILGNELNEYYKKQAETFNNLLCTRVPPLTMFPVGSFFLEIKFQLDKPYISKGDENLYILDNPIKKEKVFKLPFISPSQWKGTLRSSIRQINNFKKREDKDEQMIRLFGNIKKEEDTKSLYKGILRFYPTYFEKIGLEVINPHDRRTGAGTQPIYFETVPLNTYGIFRLLYPSFRLTQNLKEIYETVTSDLNIIIDGVDKMFSIYGFGAKVTSGFGRASIKNGKFTMRIDEKTQKKMNISEEIINISFKEFKELKSKIKDLEISGDENEK
jgi:CRISPR/Cas system CMR subunit Cmr6 (Cas7 group RAMP superfamily)